MFERITEAQRIVIFSIVESRPSQKVIFVAGDALSGLEPIAIALPFLLKGEHRYLHAPPKVVWWLDYVADVEAGPKLAAIAYSEIKPLCISVGVHIVVQQQIVVVSIWLSVHEYEVATLEVAAELQPILRRWWLIAIREPLEIVRCIIQVVVEVPEQRSELYNVVNSFAELAIHTVTLSTSEMLIKHDARRLWLHGFDFSVLGNARLFEW